MRAFTPFAIALVLSLGAFGCASEEDEGDEEVPLPAGFDPNATYTPGVTSADLSTSITNPLFPAPVGAKWTYEGKTESGTERIEIVVDSKTKNVWGAVATVIRDTVYVDDEMVEDTWDWYGQSEDGTVWYLGEDTKEYEDGEVKCECGAWEAGVDSALPGVIMLGKPTVGSSYRQEYAQGEAEDLAEVVAVDETVEVPAGSFTGCVKTRDLSLVDRSAEAFKYYCPGVGLVLEEEEGERVELIAYSGL